MSASDAEINDGLTAFLANRETPGWKDKSYAELTGEERNREHERVCETFKLRLGQRRTLATSTSYEAVILAAYRLDWDEVERLLVAAAVIEVMDEECE